LSGYNPDYIQSLLESYFPMVRCNDLIVPYTVLANTFFAKKNLANPFFLKPYQYDLHIALANNFELEQNQNKTELLIASFSAALDYLIYTIIKSIMIFSIQRFKITTNIQKSAHQIRTKTASKYNDFEAVTIITKISVNYSL